MAARNIECCFRTARNRHKCFIQMKCNKYISFTKSFSHFLINIITVFKYIYLGNTNFIYRSINIVTYLIAEAVKQIFKRVNWTYQQLPCGFRVYFFLLLNFPFPFNSSIERHTHFERTKSDATPKYIIYVSIICFGRDGCVSIFKLRLLSEWKKRKGVHSCNSSASRGVPVQLRRRTGVGAFSEMQLAASMFCDIVMRLKTACGWIFEWQYLNSWIGFDRNLFILNKQARNLEERAFNDELLSLVATFHQPIRGSLTIKHSDKRNMFQ